MRIIVWGINYAPELTGIAPFNTGLCDYLHERDHDVKMVTTFPYYPFWKKIPGDRGKLYRTDEIDGVSVHRCWHYVPATITNVRRLWHELSFGLTSFVRIIFLARPDLYVIVSPPLLLGPLASIVCWLKRRPYVLHLQDLQPDVAVGLVGIGWFDRLRHGVESWSYRHATIVSGISQGRIAALAEKDVPRNRRVLFPNWIRWYGRNAGFFRSEEVLGEQRMAFRRKFDISDHVFLASYSGNLGRKQGLDTLLAAAELLEGQDFSAHALTSDLRPLAPAVPPVLILIVGDGAVKAELTKRVALLGLKNVRMLPLLVEADYHGLLAGSDVSLILQAPGTGQYSFPTKLLSVLSVQSPVLTVADDDSELARAVNEGEFGVNVPPGAPRALAEALQKLASDPARLELMRTKTGWVRRFFWCRRVAPL